MAHPNYDNYCDQSDEMAVVYAEQILKRGAIVASVAATAFIKAGIMVLETLVGRSEVDSLLTALLTALLMAGKNKQ